MNRRLGCHLISGPVCRWQACWPLWYLLTTFPSANEVEGWRFRFPIAVVLEGCWRLHAGDNCRGSMSPMAGISATTCKQDSGAAPAPAARFVRCVSASCGRRTWRPSRAQAGWRLRCCAPAARAVPRRCESCLRRHRLPSGTSAACASAAPASRGCTPASLMTSSPTHTTRWNCPFSSSLSSCSIRRHGRSASMAGN